MVCYNTIDNTNINNKIKYIKNLSHLNKDETIIKYSKILESKETNANKGDYYTRDERFKIDTCEC